MSSKKITFSDSEITNLITNAQHLDYKNMKDSGYYFLNVKVIRGESLLYDKTKQIIGVMLDQQIAKNLEMISHE